LIAGLLFLVTALPLLELSRGTYGPSSPRPPPSPRRPPTSSIQDSFGTPKNSPAPRRKHKPSPRPSRAEPHFRALQAAIERLSCPHVHRDVLLKPEIVQALDALLCEGVSTDPNRRRYALDPWGQPYWLYYERGADRLTGTTLIYSFGPNRRYDSRKERLRERTTSAPGRARETGHPPAAVGRSVPTCRFRNRTDLPSARLCRHRFRTRRASVP
jgi:hypothetical protein